MLSRSVGRACYSTNITQDFINDLLVRAKEATTHSVTAKNQQTQNKRTNNRNNTSNYNNNRGPRTGNNGSYKIAQNGQNKERSFNNRKFNRYDRQEFDNRSHKGEVMTNSNAKSDITLQQPQFADKKNAGSESIDFIDIIQDQDKTKTHSSRKPFTQRKRESRGKKPYTRSTATSNYQNRQRPKVEVASELYYPEDNTPESLLKYSSDIYSIQSSRSKNLAVNELINSNFPVNRQPNFSSTSRYTPLFQGTNSFGKYMPAHSLILQQEAQLKNHAVESDNLKFAMAVKGKYNPLLSLTSKDFESISSNKTTQESLLQNSKAVGLALQNNVDMNRDPKRFNLIFEVCSGLKPLSELNK
ncbi:similar to Saccharomyces cerevisiae YDR494W RSM28 Mitochondrial ribosomal protein of the small subunit [Maudiozyma barnettii]|uniref:Similar to Saccharomyces cerevisiae YDR494W RSM28 Mitochondrial ribosomal protein of the small subunit n=1 Tax=Maudiozyma barnettii TaxID=61262 RepID=A0A8H2VDP7_9SACH|nr:mitochondrial 37S ribosomal protein RSM28 [Kazachstania barnettii]CAB4253592.1 similar to Saccharomyces cerevisiae YDR494W RSM28 Mitochondrial ribosomal protein of the small subunit [Kazachstania barnettii]CAD1781266.1 similar to Saccharomyces cerevisiae YDR494W RSM28 Mitochondrial ribosomal protein of the small subunit [Kazachstania barnettii]